MHKHNFSEKEWPFEDAVDIGCITTRQVMNEGFPILAILHDIDGAWQVLCDTTEDPKDGMVVSLGCLYEKFPIIGNFAHILRGYEAVRETESSTWKIIKTEYSEK